MVRSVLLAHGLNDNRGKYLERNKEFKRLMESVCRGKTVITILYCEDGLPSTWQEKHNGKRENRPEATHQRYWENLITGLGLNVWVRFRDFSFQKLGVTSRNPEHTHPTRPCRHLLHQGHRARMLQQPRRHRRKSKSECGCQQNCSTRFLETDCYM